ncbi:MAG: sulfurtransferase TusA family protein [Pseudomonadota bacterium]|nr:sulfurtransferase TusA family protein [Pseudomonadota bacterium]
MNWDEEIDAIGLLCPLPVLKLRKQIKNLKTGSIVRVLADDPAATLDIPHFCNENGHKFLSSRLLSGLNYKKGSKEYFVQKA